MTGIGSRVPSQQLHYCEDAPRTNHTIGTRLVLTQKVIGRAFLLQNYLDASRTNHRILFGRAQY